MFTIHAPSRHGTHSSAQGRPQHSTAQRSAAHHNTAGYGATHNRIKILQHGSKYWYMIKHSSAQHRGKGAGAHGGGQASRTPPGRPSWETRKCDQGPCMCPITRGFPAISLSMIPSSGDRRSSLPVPSTPSQQQGAWGPRAKGSSHQIPAAACNERGRRQTPRRVASRLLRCCCPQLTMYW